MVLLDPCIKLHLVDKTWLLFVLKWDNYRTSFFPISVYNYNYNVLNHCCSGLTQSNYKELNVLYEKYKNQGLSLYSRRKKKEIYVNYTLWDCEFCNTDTCEFSLGLEILAFPCNQFAGQEPGTNDEIQEVACTRLKAEFPIFDKVIYDKYIVTYKSLFFRCRIWSSLLCSLFIICLLFYLDLTCCK